MKHEPKFITRNGELYQLFCQLCGEVLWTNETKLKARFVLNDYALVRQVVDDTSGEVIWEPPRKEGDQFCTELPKIPYDDLQG